MESKMVNSTDTQNHRVVADINPETHARLVAFMEERNIDQSTAIDFIVSNYLNAPPPAAVRTGKTTASPSAERAVPGKEGITQEQLVTILNCDSGRLTQIRDYPVVLADYTRQRDPQGRAWEYNSDSDLYSII